MKKILLGSISIISAISLITGCGCEKTSETKKEEKNNNETTVMKDEKYEGLEFVNVSVDNNVIETIVINNTGYKYEGSKFVMKLIDSESNIIKEITDEVKEEIESGLTLIVKTKVDIDLTKVAAIEYELVKE